MNIALWVVQGLLATLFLFSGGMKLVLPLEQLSGPVTLPGPFLRFIGVAEVLGGLGLVLPGMTRIRPGLTPLAAAGLTVIMIGATVITLQGLGVVAALVPSVTGSLTLFVTLARWRRWPHPARSPARVVPPATSPP